MLVLPRKIPMDEQNIHSRSQPLRATIAVRKARPPCAYAADRRTGVITGSILSPLSPAFRSTPPPSSAAPSWRGAA
jgi:hypothetical protein